MKQLAYTAALLLGSAFSLAQAQSYTVKVTAYNALAAQTDSTPHVTATGTRTREGVVALSRDMLRLVPYGSVVRIVSPRGPGCGGFTTGPLRVEDTMAARKTRQADVVLNSYQLAKKWGICTATLQVIRKGTGRVR